MDMSKFGTTLRIRATQRMVENDSLDNPRPEDGSACSEGLHRHSSHRPLYLRSAALEPGLAASLRGH